MSCSGCGKTKNIIKGYANYVTGNNKQLAENRIPICKECKLYSHGLCTGCGLIPCWVKAKARVTEEICPQNKWPKI